MRGILDNLTNTAAPNFAGNARLTALVTGGSGPLSLLNLAYFIAGVLVLFYFIWGGYEVMLSRGDAKALASGRTRITNALLGLFIVLLSYAFVRLIGYILQISGIVTTLR